MNEIVNQEKAKEIAKKIRECCAKHLYDEEHKQICCLCGKSDYKICNETCCICNTVSYCDSCHYHNKNYLHNYDYCYAQFEECQICGYIVKSYGTIRKIAFRDDWGGCVLPDNLKQEVINEQPPGYQIVDRFADRFQTITKK